MTATRTLQAPEHAAAARPPARTVRRTVDARADLIDGLDGHCTCEGECAACAAAASTPSPLPIGPPDDVYERDAEEVADRAVAGEAVGPAQVATAPVLQRACACGESLEFGSSGLEGSEGQCTCGGGCRRCASGAASQPDLVIRPSGDMLEAEADRVADEVLAGRFTPTVAAGLPSHDQRVHTERDIDEHSSLAAAPASVSTVLASAGQPLDGGVRGSLEHTFGRDLSDVRVHTGSDATESTRAIGARAYTAGRHIVFGHHEYTPESAAGKRVLAHEVSHVIQQEASISAASIQRKMGDGHDLSSERFRGDETLEACYDDEARLTIGSVGPSVQKIQQALIDLDYDLGPRRDDGIYGEMTWSAVKKFKKDEQLGWEHMGDVGPGTMRRLDELYAQGGAPPPSTVPPVPPPAPGPAGEAPPSTAPPEPQATPAPVPAPVPPVPIPPPAPPWVSRIDVRASRIDDLGGLPVYHAFIVQYDSAKKEEFFTRGGHTKDAPPSVCPGVGRPKQSWGSFFSHILGPEVVCPFDDPMYRSIGVGPVNAKFGPGTVDWPAVTSNTALTGPDADTKPACFAKEADRISKICVAYSPCGPNSNSVAYTLLKNCGIADPQPPGGHFPGWGMLL